MKNNKTMNNTTFEEALAWYDSLSCEAKKLIKTSLESYQINSNAYVPYNKITEMLDWFDYCFQQMSKKHKVKWAKGSYTMKSVLEREFFPLKDTQELINAIYKENKTVPLCITHKLPEELRKSRLFSSEFVYVKKIQTERQDFISVSSKEDESHIESKTYYLDSKTFETQFINRYDSSNEMIDVDNKVGTFLTKTFNKLFTPNTWRYALTMTEDEEKRKILNSIIGVDNTNSKNQEPKTPTK